MVDTILPPAKYNIPEKIALRPIAEVAAYNASDPVVLMIVDIFIIPSILFSQNLT